MSKKPSKFDPADEFRFDARYGKRCIVIFLPLIIIAFFLMVFYLHKGLIISILIALGITAVWWVIALIIAWIIKSIKKK